MLCAEYFFFIRGFVVEQEHIDPPFEDITLHVKAGLRGLIAFPIMILLSMLAIISIIWLIFMDMYLLLSLL
jgi:hypothetical protein